MEKFIYICDNFLSSKECKDIIETYDRDLKVLGSPCNYEFKNLEATPFWKVICEKLQVLLEEYKKENKEVDLTPSFWQLVYLRLKKFKRDLCFGEFHSEHSITFPDRVLNVQIYLTTHNCGTEFYNGDVIKSEAGRLAIFPAYFTHTHRGQVCPQKKERYLLGGYIEFIKQGINEESLVNETNYITNGLN